jgi:nucleotide-binding universal stress UspA family protein
VFHAVLVATDLTADSVAALEYAVDLAATLSVKLHLLHVSRDTLPATDSEPFLSTASVQRENAIGPAALELQRLHERLRDSGLDCEMHVVTGVPAAEIRELARRLDVDLIVVGTRAARGLRRLLFGSVSGEICRSAHCPVLFVRSGLEWVASHRELERDLGFEGAMRSSLREV